MSNTDLLNNLPAGEGLTDPTLAYGLIGVSDYGTQMPFLNIAHMMRPWIGHTATQWNGMTTQQLEDGGYFDANGWPTHIPNGLSSIGTIWAWGGTDQQGTPAAESRAGTYVLTYEGEGTIKMGLNAHVISSQPGKIVFANPTGTQMSMSITSTDPNGTGDYIHNVSIVNEKYEGLYQAGEVFNPDWLSVVNDARELRFMDWMRTNGSSVTDWAHRPQLDSASWQDKGVPVEVMVQLANQTGTDPWFNMPAKATDAYVQSFATYVRDHLDPGLTAHVEYSNETWNKSFSQTEWMDTQAKELWGTARVNGGPPPGNLDFYAMRATQVAEIWDHTFGAQAATRVDNVLGAQNGSWWWLENRILNGEVWQANDPGHFVSPASVFDSVAVTTYFGQAMMADSGLRADLLKAIADPNVDASAWLTQKMTDPNVWSSIPDIEARWAAIKSVTDPAGLKLIAYEGGQHIQQAYALGTMTSGQVSDLTHFLTDYIRSGDMASLYQQLWDAWSQVSDGPFMQYGDVQAPSKWGSWGILSALGDVNPRAQLLDHLNQTSHSWFGDGGGSQYQQGVIKIAGDGGEVLTGTAKQDFLVGGAGNDTFVAGAGNDGINGEGGHDTLVLSGAPDQYSIAADGPGYAVKGADGTDYIVGVEAFHFSNGETLTLDQFLSGDPVAATDATDHSTDNTTDSTAHGTTADPTTSETAAPASGGATVLGDQGGMVHGTGNGSVTIANTADGSGVTINAINAWSQLGRDLGLSDSSSGYVVAAKSASATIDGQDVSASYWSLQEDRASKDGAALTGSALTTAQLLGSVLTHTHDITLTDASDRFIGGGADERILGGGGNDYIATHGGNDVLLGGDGNDTLLGGAGNDTLAGGAGNDLIDGGAGNDQLLLQGVAQDYVLTSQADGKYVLEGPKMDGTDIIENIETFHFADGVVMGLGALLAQSAQTPAPQAEAPAVAETAVEATGALSVALKGDVVQSAAPRDMVLQLSSDTGVVVDSVNPWSALGKSLGLTVSHDPAFVLSEKGTTADFGGTNVGANYWSLQNNVAVRDGEALNIDAQDTTKALGSVVVNAASLTLTEGNDIFHGSGLADVIYGGGGNDVLDGRGGNDVLNGGGGNDWIVGGGGDNRMTGGAGRDRFVIGTQDGHDVITDFTQEDTLDLRALHLTSVDAAKDMMSTDPHGDLQFTHDHTTVVFEGLHETDLSWMSLLT
ncbi:hypothetical protein U879_08575 [Defluviimonas sp. 20V17]|uniref:Ca2+-binding protein, RTX toxin-related n=1 Tax=Allgaiera indica TaxID=765699 RepID=A0AAN4UNP4_9RHOB|nr:calcium-binding protein [Allgaiera indica]KDB04100.1 hypothetical protein U879_08575 [Defluviimonas sp. 20V17]GHD98541.1 hypothetical protein GCM10008024_02470 [Allgaiera indica]SDW11432.1 Ca2+-binding protein, RTX toxin-related [Allgaiera indica]